MNKTPLRPCVKAYAKEIRVYLEQPVIVDSIEHYYHLQEIIATQRQQTLLAHIEGNITGAALSQRGVKRVLEEDGGQWSEDHDEYRASGISRKLHDGILANQTETVAVIIESSGSEANTSHIIEGTYKQLKSISDFLKHLSKTLINIKVPCATVISNRLTLCLATIHSNSKWRFVEARPCIIPTIANEKKAWIKAFQFLACLEDVVGNN